MFELANKFYSCEILDIKTERDEAKLFKSLLRSKPILIAYDCDFNFEPCNKQGVKAHWALITGILVPVESKLLSNNESDANLRLVPFEKHYTDEVAQKYAEHFSNGQIDKSSIRVICKHGKSKLSGIWKLSDLLKSNNQLEKVDPDKCDPTKFVLPENGILKNSLASKVLIFK